MTELYKVEIEKEGRTIVSCHWDPVYGVLRVQKRAEDRRYGRPQLGEMVPLSWFETGKAELIEVYTLEDRMTS